MKLSHSVSGAVRQFSYWIANGTVGHPLLQGIDYFDEFKENPSLLETVYAIFINNLEIDENGNYRQTLFNDNEDKWSTFYMGDDGTFTMYVDIVEDVYAKNSCMPQEERYPIGNKTIDEMFNDIKMKYNTNE